MDFVRLALIIILIYIFYQDYKSRLVYWFLYPLAGAFAFYIHARSASVAIAFTNALANIAFCFIMLLIALAYVRLKLKLNLKDSIGSGDILFFVFISFSFSIISFLVLLIFSLIFALVTHLLLKKAKQPDHTVPLAGYMAFFFSQIYAYSLFFDTNFLYAY